MALHILNTGPTTGEKFGQSLSTGLSALAEGKLAQIQHRNQAAKNAFLLEEMVPGKTKEQYLKLAQSDPELLQQYVKIEAGNKFANDFAKSLGIQTPQATNTATQEAAQSVGIQSQQPQVSSRERSEFEVPPPPIMKPIPGKKVVAEQKILETPTLESLAPQVKKLIEGGYPLPKNQKEATELFKEAHKANIEEKKLAFKEKQFTAGEKTEAFKETKAERQAIIESAKSARQNLNDLERMEELEKEGKLDTPGYVEFLQRSGLDIPALMNPGSEEFQKIQQTFIRDVKNYVGSRVSNFELEQFLKTIPTLSQSPEGRNRVISNLKRFARINLEYKDALKEVVNENNGIPPLDLAEQIDEKIDKRLNKITNQFKEDLKKPVPAGQNRFITALQATLGSLAAPALGAGAGALLGGPIGALAGGLGAGGASAIIGKLAGK